MIWKQTIKYTETTSDQKIKLKKMPPRSKPPAHLCSGGVLQRERTSLLRNILFKESLESGFEGMAMGRGDTGRGSSGSGRQSKPGGYASGQVGASIRCLAARERTAQLLANLLRLSPTTCRVQAQVTLSQEGCGSVTPSHQDRPRSRPVGPRKSRW